MTAAHDLLARSRREQGLSEVLEDDRACEQIVQLLTQKTQAAADTDPNPTTAVSNDLRS